MGVSGGAALAHTPKPRTQASQHGEPAVAGGRAQAWASIGPRRPLPLPSWRPRDLHSSGDPLKVGCAPGSWAPPEGLTFPMCQLLPSSVKTVTPPAHHVHRPLDTMSPPGKMLLRVRGQAPLSSLNAANPPPGALGSHQPAARPSALWGPQPCWAGAKADRWPCRCEHFRGRTEGKQILPLEIKSQKHF